MKTIFKDILYIFIFIFALQGQAAELLCKNLFLADSETLWSTQFLISNDTVNSIPFPQVLPQLSRAVALDKIQKVFSQFRLSLGVTHLNIAMNLSPKNTFHVVSSRASQAEHQRVLDFIRAERVEFIFAQMPNWYRNKYFELSIDSANRVQVSEKFSWQLSMPVKSQLDSGFAQTDTKAIRAFKASEGLKDDRVRFDLIDQRRSQETLATCGLSSLAQVLNAHGIALKEADLMTVAEHLNIKPVHELFGTAPGLELDQLLKIAQALGARYGYTVEIRHVESAADLSHFVQIVSDSTTKNLDVILNYLSPVIGRPGAGHFSPVGGFNSKTQEVLLSETNLASSPPFWSSAINLIQAMKPAADMKSRGYLIFKWN